MKRNMNLIWYGQSCFQLFLKPNRDRQISIVMDPFSEKIGLKLPRLKADIVCVSHEHYDHNNVKAVSGPSSDKEPFLINGPGEYEIENIFIQGIFSWHDNCQGRERGENTIYTIEAEDIRLCHLGDLGQRELTEEQLEKIGEVDILMIPVGGVYTIGASQASKIISQIEPRLIIPMHYYIPRLKIKLDPLDKFLKNFGLRSVEPVKKLSVKKKDLSDQEAKIVVMKT